MAKRNSGTSSSGRRSSRTNSTGGSSSRQGKSSGKPYKKSGSSGERRSSDSSKRGGGSARPFKKSGGYRRDEGRDQDSKRPFRTKDGETGRPQRASTNKRFSDKPVRKRTGDKREESEGNPRERFRREDGGTSRPQRASTNKRSSDKPVRKRIGDKREDSEKDPRKRFRKEDGGPRTSRGFQADKKYSERPSPRKRSFDKNENPEFRSSGSENRKDRSKKSDSYGLPFKRTYPKKSREGGSESRDKESHRFFNKEKSGYQGKRDKGDEATAPVQSDKIRLNRFIANSGVCSRREADELIAMGLITVNGKTITEMGYKVNPGDEVRYESKVLTAEKPVYILLNKPKGYLTTTEDPQERNTVMHIVGGSVKERIYPVGRLDRNTTGLLLLTNDGELADKLMHPSYNVKKIYKVELDKPLTKGDFQKISEGVMLEEGRATVDDIALVSDDGKTVGVEIHIGWNRVIRRIFESLGYAVVRLDRSVYAGLDKKDLGRGEWRHLKREEIVRLKHFK